MLLPDLPSEEEGRVELSLGRSVLLLALLGDELVLLALGHGLVVREFHGELALALGDGPQLGRVSEHSAEGDGGLHEGRVSRDGSGAGDGTLSAVHGLQASRLEFGRESDGDRHDRLEDDRGAILVSRLEGSESCGLERFGGRIDLMRLAILQDDPHVDARVTRQETLLGSSSEALLDGRHVVGRDLVAGELADKLDALFRSLLGGHGLEVADDLSVLTAAARLALVGVVERSLDSDGLAVVHLRFAGDQGLTLVLAPHPLAVDVQVQLAHAADDGLVGVLLRLHSEGGILALEASQGLLESGLVLSSGRDRERHHSIRDEHGAAGNSAFAVGEGDTRVTFHTSQGDNVTSAGSVDILDFVGVHANHALGRDLLLGHHVHDRSPLVQRTLIDSHVGHLSSLRMILDLEGVADKGLRRVVLEDDLLALIVSVHRFVHAVQGRGKVTANGVQKILHALVLVRRAHQHGTEGSSECGAADGIVDGLHGNLAFVVLQKDLSELVVEVRERLEKLSSELLGLLLHLLGNLVHATGHAILALEVVGLVGHEVADTCEVVLFANWQLDGVGGESQLASHLTEDVERVRTISVKLVDEDDARNFVPLHLPVDGHGLRLNAANTTADHDSSIQDSQGPLHLDGEVDVAWCVDEVHVVLVAIGLPRAESGRGRNGDALLSLKLHAVHLGANTILTADLVNFLDAPSVEKHSLSECRLSTVDVGRDAEIPDVRELKVVRERADRHSARAGEAAQLREVLEKLLPS
mmetsp:Transcript_46096/g.99535  ORF Transcript_46096/g.99535 Transcript_46096/m.99535 type:complete len:754 (+) Transcript_46096:3-2264(+)